MRTANVLALALLAATEAAGLSLTSPAFSAGAAIPSRFTCQGKDVSPALEFSHVPKGTKTLALVVTDPDAPDPAAPQGTFTHWIVYDIPPGTKGLVEAGDAQLPTGARAGTNDFGRTGWGGPCPPAGKHRYVFTLYALDRALGDLDEPTRERLEKAMEGRVLEKAELVGTFQKAE